MTWGIIKVVRNDKGGGHLMGSIQGREHVDVTTTSFLHTKEQKLLCVLHSFLTEAILQ